MLNSSSEWTDLNKFGRGTFYFYLEAWSLAQNFGAATQNSDIPKIESDHFNKFMLKYNRQGLLTKWLYWLLFSETAGSVTIKKGKWIMGIKQPLISIQNLIKITFTNFEILKHFVWTQKSLYFTKILV